MHPLLGLARITEHIKVGLHAGRGLVEGEEVVEVEGASLPAVHQWGEERRALHHLLVTRAAGWWGWQGRWG